MGQRRARAELLLLRELFVWSRPRCAPLPFALRAGGDPPPEIRAARPPASDAHHPPPAAAMDISAMAEVTQSAGLAELIEKGLMPSQKKPIKHQATFTMHMPSQETFGSAFGAL